MMNSLSRNLLSANCYFGMHRT